MQVDQKSREYSAQTRARDNGNYAYGVVDGFGVSTLFQRGRRITDVPYYMPDAGGLLNRQRDQALRRLETLPGGEPTQAAISSIIQKIQACDWTIEGPAKAARRIHTLLNMADFGQGLEAFQARGVRDYLTQDNGMFWEVLGDGPDLTDDSGNPVLDRSGNTIINTLAPMAGPVLGLSHIDSSRCIRTGDLTYPVIYWDLTGGKHKLHYTRVLFASDLPSPSEHRLGVGFCALSRSVAATQTLINWSTMRNELIDDMPPLGILTFNGVNKEAFDKQYKAYQADRAGNEEEMYRGLLSLFSVGQDIKVEMLNFRQTWEGFTEKDLYNMCIDLVAMAFNVDRQELAPITSSAMGSGGQSKSLSKKQRGKGVDNILSLIGRMINRVIPESCRFKFDYMDDDEALQQAQIRQMRANTILSLYTASAKGGSVNIDNVAQTTPSVEGGQKPLLSYEEARYLLARDGVIPREILSPNEKLNPEWEQFDNVLVKARYGDTIKIDKQGHEWRQDKPFYSVPRPIVLKLREKTVA